MADFLPVKAKLCGVKNNTSENGIVLDVHRFSVFDGPGIRTTVFLKGCPLRCKWCHNPESISFKPQISYISSKCVNCGECVAQCKQGVHFFDEAKNHQVDFSKCILDKNCVQTCEYGALKIYGKIMSVFEVMEQVRVDKNYFQNSGGGVTVSGGEPLFQTEFVKELFRNSKKEGISTCLDTSGYSCLKKINEVLPYTDIVLFDYKVSNSIKHKNLTGVNNNIILENLDYIYNSGVGVILKCPLIPGINDEEEHLKGIVGISRKYPKFLGVEIMPFHATGAGKYKEINMDYLLKHLGTTSEEKRNEWKKFFDENNCEVKIN